MTELMRMFWLIGRLEGTLEVVQERITRLGRGQGPIIDLTKDSEPPAERSRPRPQPRWRPSAVPLQGCPANDEQRYQILGLK
jgi:hypothetical protein